MSLLFRNISLLAGVLAPEQTDKGPLKGRALAELDVRQNAWLLTKGERIEAFGTMDQLPASIKADEEVDATGRILLPAWCDSHTHMVFAASRESEFIDKIRGLGYAEIAAKGGGILNSATRLNEMPEDELYRLARKRLEAAIRQGTGAIEIKSGYGLTVEGELRMLRVIRRLKQSAPIPVKATFLGAHAFPARFRDDHEGYIRMIEEEMLPAIAEEGLADFIDVFCETGFFSPEETERICRAGMGYGLVPKIHANQLNLSGGVEVGVKLGALSVDHLETMDEPAIQCLAASGTIGTLLPTAAFFLRMPYQPARQLINAGCAIALASDFNPGSSPSFNMNLVLSLACIQLKMLPEEAINAATINGAFAMGLARETGSITAGKLANLVLTRQVPSLAYLPYAFGESHIDRVYINGKEFGKGL